MFEFSFNSMPADEMIQKFTVLFYNRDTAVTEIIYCKLYVYIVGHIKNIVYKKTPIFHLYTVQATGTAALHACFMRGNPPYCMQIPREKHS